MPMAQMSVYTIIWALYVEVMWLSLTVLVRSQPVYGLELVIGVVPFTQNSSLLWSAAVVEVVELVKWRNSSHLGWKISREYKKEPKKCTWGLRHTVSGPCYCSLLFGIIHLQIFISRVYKNKITKKNVPRDQNMKRLEPLLLLVLLLPPF